MCGMETPSTEPSVRWAQLAAEYLFEVFPVSDAERAAFTQRLQEGVFRGLEIHRAELARQSVDMDRIRTVLLQGRL